MLRMSRQRRALTLLWAVLQLALPSLASLAEAAIARDAPSAGAREHVEQRSGPGCRPVHAPDCARCQDLSTHAAVTVVPAVDWIGIARPMCATAGAAGRATRLYRALPPSRAPPQRS